MRLQPDIVVTKSDSTEVLLVVEVKDHIADIETAEASLKAYMVHMSCPVGMLVTWVQTRFYRNRYTGYEPQTVEMVGMCATSELLGPTPAQSPETYLERLVEEWLERIRTGSRQLWPPSVRQAIEESVLPVIFGGVVRAAGPRWRRTGS